MQYYENEKLVMEFFVLFSRFEYALKRSGFVKGKSNYVKVDRNEFARSIKNKFDPEDNKALRNAVEYISKNPPKKQILKNEELRWKEQAKIKNKKDIVKLLKYVATVRNNLFHGGKFPEEPFKEPARNKKLLNSSIVILKEIISYDYRLERCFKADFVYENII